MKSRQEAAPSQARLIEAVARFDELYSRDYPGGARQATIDQIRDAHMMYKGIGVTGEFALAERNGDRIDFLLAHRHHDLDHPHPVPWGSHLAEPMRLALSGRSGTIIGTDYRGAKVLAAFEPVAELGLGIVAKIDMTELRAPFLRAALVSVAIAGLVIACGVALFFRVTNPLLARLQTTVDELQTALPEVRTLRGIVPICSYCKNIRDDDGYWRQVEIYVSERSGADFSHGICPDCLEKHFPDVTGGV